MAYGAMKRRLMARAAAAASAAGTAPLAPADAAQAAFRLALARALRDCVGVAVDVGDLRLDAMGLGELVGELPDQALITVLDRDGGEGLGVMALSAPILSALVEMLTTGRVHGTAPDPRRPTRTDAAMLAPMLDAALAGLEQVLAEQAQSRGQGGAVAGPWRLGWRYASFLDEPRPLALMLDEGRHQVLRADLALARGQRRGEVWLALPDAAMADSGKSHRTARARSDGPAPPQLADGPQDAAGDGGFTDALASRVSLSEARLDAVLARLTLQLSQVMALTPGAILPLGAASLDHVVIEGAGGQAVGQGRLGQQRGLRAVKLCLPPDGP